MTDVTPVKRGVEEPVIISGVVLWVLTQVGLFLTTHTHLIDSAHWTSLTNFLAPIITTAVIAAVTWITRKFVSPAWKVVTGDLNKIGLPAPTDAQLEQWADDLYNAFIVKKTVAEAHEANAALPAAEQALGQQVPMQAGAIEGVAQDNPTA